MVTRRDFLNGAALCIAGGLTPAALGRAAAAPAYPPALSGMRGNHPGSFETAHLLGWGQESYSARALPVEESYDLVVVGAGISGLAAAWFYRQRHAAARVLILDNHDDFGGHATRNEFRVGERLLLSYGGSESLQSPKALYSDVAKGLLRSLAVDIERFHTAFDQNLYPSLGLSRGVFFDRENFGRDALVTGDPTPAVADDIPPGRHNAKPIHEFIAGFPLSARARAELTALHAAPGDYLGGMSREEKLAHLARTSYRDYLLNDAKLSEEAVKYFQGRSLDFFALGADAIPAADARDVRYPGFDALGLDGRSAAAEAEMNEPYIYHFPDGNASLARLLVRALIPAAAPGRTMDDIVAALLDYAALDRAGAPVRLRLNSTAVAVENVNGPVSVGYMYRDRLHRVSARQVVLACYNMMAGHLVPEMKEAQRAALRQCVKAPLVYTKVVIRDWRAFVKLGVHEIYSPLAFHSRVKLDYPVHLGGYRSPVRPEEPMCLHLVHVPGSPNSGMTARALAQVGRAKLLQATFADFEREIRAQLDAMLAPGGFSAARDILAITVNRWSHGYAYTHNTLFDKPGDQKTIPARARQRIGQVTIANSDASWEPYAQAAIDQAWRAVDELG
jgi:spermidine dehydrogenase